MALKITHKVYSTNFLQVLRIKNKVLNMNRNEIEDTHSSFYYLTMDIRNKILQLFEDFPSWLLHIPLRIRYLDLEDKYIIQLSNKSPRYMGVKTEMLSIINGLKVYCKLNYHSKNIHNILEFINLLYVTKMLLHQYP